MRENGPKTEDGRRGIFDFRLLIEDREGAGDGKWRAIKKKIKQGLERWNAWREENPNIKIDLKETNLAGTNLEGANLN